MHSNLVRLENSIFARAFTYDPYQGHSQRFNHVEAQRIKSNFTFLIANNKGTDQTVWMCRLVCAFVVASSKVRIFCVETHMMLEPRPPPGYAPDTSCVCGQ